ncbi:MAG: hypothetical protein II290_04040 [Oscillospiraceae bacterium]|nr:hypothetical protein [Oscillospiraceae bacterium]
MDETTQDTGYEEFMTGLEGDGYQTETAAEPEVQEPEGQDPKQTDPEVPETEPAEDAEPEGEGDPEPVQTDTDPVPEPQVFTLKVNKEERQVSREEMIELAQKGADYDRVKEQAKGQQEVMEVLSALAKEAQTDIPGLMDSFRIGMLKKQGLSEDAARERLAREKAERENEQLKANRQPPAETAAQRARREVEEFRQVYPKVELSDDLMKKLMSDVQEGKTLTEAYRKHEAAEKDAKIAELERQLEAEKQNRRNRAGSPGSQKDSGGRHGKSEFDDFLKALQ